MPNCTVNWQKGLLSEMVSSSLLSMSKRVLVAILLGSLKSEVKQIPKHVSCNVKGRCIFLAPFIEAFVKNLLTVCTWINFWAPYCITLVYVLVSVPVPFYFNYYMIAL
jgi:hypothetical protein